MDWKGILKVREILKPVTQLAILYIDRGHTWRKSPGVSLPSAYKIADIWHVGYRRLNPPTLPSLPVPAIFSSFHSESQIKLINQGGDIITWLLKWRKTSKIVSEPKKKKSIWSHCGPKGHAFLMQRRATVVIVSRMRSRSSTIFFYCPTFQNASWSALVAKLWQQLTIFFASLSPFCFFTLVHAIFKRHPMEPGIKAEVMGQKKNREVCSQRSVTIKFAAIGVENRQVCRRLNLGWKGILKVRETLT